MKSRTLRIASMTALSTMLGMLLLPSVFAQDSNSPSDRPLFEGGRMHGPGIGARRGQGPRQVDPDTMIERLDNDGDGRVSEEEFLATQLSRLDNMFERRDNNGDGLLTEDESRPERRANGAGRENRLHRLDITQKDITACVRNTIPDFDPPQGPDAADIAERFDEVDTNNDGGLSLAEITAAAESRADARFDRLDSDTDGFITAAEIESQQEQQQDVRKAMRACVRELAAG